MGLDNYEEGSQLRKSSQHQQLATAQRDFSVIGIDVATTTLLSAAQESCGAK